MEEVDDPIMSALKADKEKYPEKYKLANLPPLWFSLQPMNIYPDSLMHLFSGIIKAVIKLSFCTLKEDSKLDSFLKIMKTPKNISMISSMNIPWFPLM